MATTTNALVDQLMSIAQKVGKDPGKLTHQDLVGGGMASSDAYTAMFDMTQSLYKPPSSVTNPTPTAAAQQLGASVVNQVIKDTPGAQATIQQNAQTQNVDLNKVFGANAVEGLGYNPPQPKPATPAPQPVAAPAPQQAPQPQAQPFQYSPSGYRLNQDQANQVAQQRAALATQYQMDAVRQALNRRLQTLNQSAQAIPQQLAGAQARNDEEAARAGFFTSGRRFALRDGSNQEATRQLGQIEQARNQAVTEAGDAERNIARDQGNMYASLVDQLLRDDRDYGLRERSQQYSEFSGDRQFGLQQQAHNDMYQQGGLGYQTRYADLVNRMIGNQSAQAAYNDTYNPGGIGYQSRQAALEGQQLGNRQANAAYQDTYTPGGIGYQQRIQQLDAGALANERSTLQNKVAQMEYQFAQETMPQKKEALQLEIDKARKGLDLVDAQIRATNAQANQRETGGASGGLTPYQQYQVERNAIMDGQKAREKVVDTLTKEYAITPRAADAWIDLQEIMRTPKADGSLPTYQDVYPILTGILQKGGFQDQDYAWLNVIFQAATGNDGARSNLYKYTSQYLRDNPNYNR